MINNFVFVALFLLGFYAILVKKNLIKMVIGLNIMEGAIFYWFITLTDRGGTIPIVNSSQVVNNLNDPIPQALILTGIVIGASTSAFLLTLIIELNKFTSSTNPDQLGGMIED
ncbi:MAG: sodium:proton antiporter [Bacillota bacterium]|nr:NADH-quinone oxidoreductase subunit K [Halanaerobiales bacterium]